MPEIILYHYTASPYARRIVWYLNLRGIPYTQCMQPMIMPRPDVQAIGTSYRRIPVMAIGRDVYNDTRLILSKLEVLYSSHTPLSSSSPEHKAFERLLETWAVDSGLFTRAAQLIPSHFPIWKDPKFTNDRAELAGRPWSQEGMEKLKPENLVEFKRAFEFLETTLLADGRQWLLKTEEPSLADIEAVWPFHWLYTMPGSLPPNLISAKQFPKVFAWIQRFDKTVKAAASKRGKPKTVKGDEAASIVSASEFAEQEGHVDSEDPLGLKKGDTVEVFPTDSGSNHKDKGLLVALNGKEIVVESKTKEGKTVRVHAPRHGFRVRGVKGSQL